MQKQDEEALYKGIRRLAVWYRSSTCNLEYWKVEARNFILAADNCIRGTDHPDIFRDFVDALPDDSE